MSQYTILLLLRTSSRKGPGLKDNRVDNKDVYDACGVDKYKNLSIMKILFDFYKCTDV